ncbi:hypothetical protein MPSEU_000554500 [Mayamaea pseudoterrestris]|nr:hypothetical protein MPSEU_000554500 [Mayamaea pseudoterrestris]
MTPATATTAQSPLGRVVTIPIHFAGSNADGDDVPEWAMIEINGELVVPPLNDDADDDDADEEATKHVRSDQLELGSIRFDGETPVMILGSHELIGTVETLKQPFCVLRKEVVEPLTDNEFAMSEETPANADATNTSASSSDSSRSVSYVVQGVVTRKLLFNKYPKVIMRSMR